VKARPPVMGGCAFLIFLIVRMLANGDIIEDLLAAYPNLERADILACLDYAPTQTHSVLMEGL